MMAKPRNQGGKPPQRSPGARGEQGKGGGSRPAKPSTASIQQLQNRGLDKSQIVAKLTGTKDGSGGAKQLTARQLDQIGFSDKFIQNVKGKLPPGTAKPPTGGKPGSGDGDVLPEIEGPLDPTEAYLEFLKQQQEDAQLKYNQDAIASLTALFKTYGLESLVPHISQWVNAGMGESAIVAQLRETKEYKQRFPGMTKLRESGYNAISEAEYLQLEDSYHQALQTAGLPAGFYDDPTDFVQFMSNGIDPGELKQRATAAVDLAHQVDPAQREMLSSMYGVGAGDIAAYFLDPKKAMPILQKQLGSVRVASAAKHAGVRTDFGNRGRFERLVDNGIGAEQAAQGYSQIASELDPLKNLAAIWGGGWSLDDAEDATFFGNADAQRKRKRLGDTERAAFSGASGFDARVSGRGSTAGSF